MAIPSSKSELLPAIKESYEKLAAELKTIPESFTKTKDLEGHAKGTTMSLNNLLAYLTGWGQLVLKWNKKREQGLEVDFPETGYKWNALGSLARKFYKDFEKDDWNSLQKKLDKTVQELSLVESRSDKELYKVAWYETYTLGRMIQLNTASPYTNAKARIRKWKKAKGLK